MILFTLKRIQNWITELIQSTTYFKALKTKNDYTQILVIRYLESHPQSVQGILSCIWLNLTTNIECYCMQGTVGNSNADHAVVLHTCMLQSFEKDESRFINTGLIQSQVSTAYLIVNEYKVETSTENVFPVMEFNETSVFLIEISSLKSTQPFLYQKKDDNLLHFNLQWKSLFCSR